MDYTLGHFYQARLWKSWAVKADLIELAVKHILIEIVSNQFESICHLSMLSIHSSRELNQPPKTPSHEIMKKKKKENKYRIKQDEYEQSD